MSKVLRYLLHVRVQLIALSLLFSLSLTPSVNADAWAGLCHPHATISKQDKATYGQPDSLFVTSLDNESFDILHSASGRSAVLVFILHDCPICNAYAPELNRIATYCEVHGLKMSIVYVDADLSQRDAKKHYAAYGFSMNALLDSAQALVKYYRVTVASEAVVLDRAGNVIYRGPIDNANPQLGTRSAKPTTTDLRNALKAYIEGKPIPPPTSKLIGCYLEN